MGCELVCVCDCVVCENNDVYECVLVWGVN